jgi:putative endonuclease
MGNIAETFVTQYLISIGISIVERNNRTRWGEIDIIGWDEGTLVFYEVKSSSHRGFLTTPVENVTPYKIHKIRNMAKLYIGSHFRSHPECRFDVVSVIIGKDREPEIEILSSAF